MSTFILFVLNLMICKALDNGLAKTPPMGWLAWERFRCNIDCKSDPDNCISAKLYKEMADRLVADGYKDVGYNYLNIDDCWMAMERDKVTQNLLHDPVRFSKGMPDLVEYIHSKGLKAGMYASFGERTCMGYPGSIHHLEVDAKLFALWKFDYLKFDGCFTPTELLNDGYRQMGKHLNGSGRPMVYSCSWPYYQHVVGIEPNFTEIGDHCNLWRVWHDIDDTWYSIDNIIEYYVKYENILKPAAGPGHWNDPDMLIIGNFGLSYEQSKSQMALWAILAAPLIMSNDLRNIRPEYRDILTNKKVIAINQDRLGIQGGRIAHKQGLSVWTRPLYPNDSMAILLFNNRVDGNPKKFNIPLHDTGLLRKDGYLIEEVFGDMAPVRMFPNQMLLAKVPPTGVKLYVAKPYTNQLEVDLLANVAAVDAPVVQKHMMLQAADEGKTTEDTHSFKLLVFIIITTSILIILLSKRILLRFGSNVCRMLLYFVNHKPN